MRTYIEISAVVLLILVGWLYGHSRYEAGRNDLIAEQSVTARQNQKASEARQEAGDAGAGKVVQAGQVKEAEAKEKTVTVVKTIKEYVHDNPAPAVCTMSPGDPVLRDLAAGTERANAAARAVSGARPTGVAASSSSGL